MKTVSGNVVSSKPISLPKAAKILSKFVTVENGASHATSAYLQSASTAFDELAHLHKELKAPKSEHKSKHCELDCAKELGQETELSAEPRQSITFDLSEEPYEGLGGDRKKQKKSKKRKVDADHTGNLGDNEGNLNGYLSNGAEKNAVVGGEKKKNKKQWQNWKDEKGNLVESGMEAVVRNDGGVKAIDEAKKKANESTNMEEKGGDFSEQSSNKKQKKKGGDDGSLQDNGVTVKERESSRKKREHEEIEEGREEGGFVQHPNKKLKKRKNSDEH